VKKTGERILNCFPKLPDGFNNELSQALIRNKFTNQRFTDAVNYVIDNHVYPIPSISEFVS